ncbi:DUF1840 domain-containing protein [Rhodoferax aquaticus]|nr:DUF1840 domain-containing protein [Rhodoferax aquaticus]
MYKFKSKAAADVIMLDASAQHLLRIIGKDDTADFVKGILLPADMPGAINALEKAVAHEEAERAQKAKEALARGETPARVEGVTLRQRTTPFIAMLERCHKADKDIVWGV